MNPLDLRGPEFLGLYLGCAIGALFLWAVLREFIRGPGGTPRPDELVGLHPYEIAFLVGGAEAAVDTALAHLVLRNRVAVHEDGLILGPQGPELQLVADGVFRGFHTEQTASHGLQQADDLDQLVLDVLRDQGAPVGIKTLRDKGARTSERLGARLVSRELLIPDYLTGKRTLPLVPMMMVAVLGVLKLVVGLARDRPVLLLVLLLAATLFAILLLPRMPLHTRRGDRAHKVLKQENAALALTASTAPQQLSTEEAALAYGIFGVSALGGALAGLQLQLQAANVVNALGGFPAVSGSSCGSSCSSYFGSSCGSSCSSSSGSSCGGDSSGCGGCG